MSDLRKQADEFSGKLEAQIRNARSKSEREALAFTARPLVGDADTRLRDYDAQLTQRIAQAYRALEQTFAAHGLRPQILGRVALSGTPELKQLDQIFFQTFQLQQRLPLADFRYDTIFCETLPEFFSPLLEAYELSATLKAEIMQQMIAEAEQTARETKGGGTFGYNLPGQGCFLNGWLFNYGRNGSPRALLSDQRQLQRILETAAHEKLGHGFITEFTALGAEKKTLGLQQIENARRFNIKTVDTPAQALLVEKHNLVHLVSQFTEEGWATWIGVNLIQMMFAPDQPRAARYALQKVWDAVSRMSIPAASRQALLSALQVLFLEENVTPDDMHNAMLFLQGLLGSDVRRALDDYLFKTLGQSAPYVIGSLLMDKIESRFGALCLPYAVMIACSVTFDLAQIGAADLGRLVATQNHLNPDSRLAALSTLKPSALNDVPALAKLAREQLGFAVPTELTG